MLDLAAHTIAATTPDDGPIWGVFVGLAIMAAGVLLIAWLIYGLAPAIYFGHNRRMARMRRIERARRRAALAQIMFTNGLMTPDEYRAMRGPHS